MEISNYDKQIKVMLWLKTVYDYEQKINYYTEKVEHARLKAEYRSSTIDNSRVQLTRTPNDSRYDNLIKYSVILDDLKKKADENNNKITSTIAEFVKSGYINEKIATVLILKYCNLLSDVEVASKLQDYTYSWRCREELNALETIYYLLVDNGVLTEIN